VTSPPLSSWTIRACAFAAAIVVSALVLWHFHDRFWLPADEGIYANLADRVASGETLNLEVQELHPGYGTFLNAAALEIFGRKLVSLRYPLIAAALLQVCIAFVLLARRSVLLASLGAVATAALGVIQFLNPTPNWYCLALAFILAVWMHAFPRNSATRLVGAGFLVGLAVLFRQISGVWLGIAVVVIALLETPETPARRSVLARSTLALLLLLTVVVLVAARQDEPGGIVMFALWPMAILLIAWRRVTLGDREAVVALLQLAAGAGIAAVPLLVHLLAEGSAAAWFNDTVATAAHLTDIVATRRWGAWYAALMVTAAPQVVVSRDLTTIANGVYWSILPALAAVNGVLTIRALRRGEDSPDLILPVVAAFYALVSLFMQNAMYLYFTVGLTLTAVLWSVGRSRLAIRTAWAALTVLLSVVAVACHAAQPFARSTIELLEGRRTSTDVVDCALPRCGLRLERSVLDPYRQVVTVIQTEVPPGAAIAVFPSDAELYFLSDRRNPFRFYNAAIGLRSPADVERTLAIMHREAPRIMTFRPDDKYATAATRAVVARVRPWYDHIASVSGIEVYRLKSSDVQRP
jgi:hypothetical protein